MFVDICNFCRFIKKSVDLYKQIDCYSNMYFFFLQIYKNIPTLTSTLQVQCCTCIPCVCLVASALKTFIVKFNRQTAIYVSADMTTYFTCKCTLCKPCKKLTNNLKIILQQFFPTQEQNFSLKININYHLYLNGFFFF